MTGPFRHSHHNAIHAVLSALDTGFLEENRIFFCGGTLLSLTHDEYRRSDDVDFIPDPSGSGYRNLRNRMDEKAGILFPVLPPRMHVSSVRSDQYGVRMLVTVQEVPVKLEIFQESRVRTLSAPEWHSNIPVPCLARHDLAVQKLLANTDRGLDSAVCHRDVYDLAMLAKAGVDMKQAIEQASCAYDVRKLLKKVLVLVCENRSIRQRDFDRLEIAGRFYPDILEGLALLGDLVREG